MSNNTVFVCRSVEALCVFRAPVAIARAALRRVYQLGVLFLIPAAFPAVSGCTFVLSDDEEVTVLVYNIENLFDAVDDGTEYSEFTSEGGWTQRDYRRRKQRIAEAVHSFQPAPDIMVFVEIENEHVLDALVEDYIVDINAPYRAFTKGPRAAVGIGVASRYPITDVRSHLARSDMWPPLRPVLETTVDVSGTPLYIFSNHWKSKRGGAPETEPLRRASAALLSERLGHIYRDKRNASILVVGDFNERPREFELTGGEYPTALMPAEWVGKMRTLLHAGNGASEPGGTEDTPDRNNGVGAPEDDDAEPEEDEDTQPGEDTLPDWVTKTWLDDRDYLLLSSDAVAARAEEEWFNRPVFVNTWDLVDQPGSYFFIDRWEKIDSIFASPVFFDEDGFAFESLSVPCPPGACDSRQRPLSWKDDERGVSDHLPLLFSFSTTQ